VSSSPSLKHEIFLDALQAVRHVYESINDLLCMATNQNGLSHVQQRRWVDQELEESVKLLDICSTSRDNLDMIKAKVLDLEIAIRKGDSEAIKSKVRDYSLITKKANKNVRWICKNNESADGDYLAVISILSEIREITISLLQSIFSYLSRQLVAQKTSTWSLVSRLLEKRTIASKEKKGKDSCDAACLRINVEELENELEGLFRHMIQCRVSLLNISSL
jgi:Arabidopsis protein of unknown function